MTAELGPAGCCVRVSVVNLPLAAVVLPIDMLLMDPVATGLIVTAPDVGLIVTFALAGLKPTVELASNVVKLPALRVLAPIVPVKVAFVPVMLLLNVTALEKVGDVEFTVSEPPPSITPPLTVKEERVPIEVKFAAEVTLGKEVVVVVKRVPLVGNVTVVVPVEFNVIAYAPEVLKLPPRLTYLLLTENPVEPTVMLSTFKTPLSLL